MQNLDGISSRKKLDGANRSKSLDGTNGLKMVHDTILADINLIITISSYGSGLLETPTTLIDL